MHMSDLLICDDFEAVTLTKIIIQHRTDDAKNVFTTKLNLHVVGNYNKAMSIRLYYISYIKV